MTQTNEVSAVETNPLSVSKELKFTFRVIDKDKPTEFKRDAFKFTAPVPTVAGLVAALTGDNEKVKKLITDVMEETVKGVLKNKINELIENDSTGAIKLDASMFKLSDLTLEAIASIPAGERGTAIAKEALDAFIKDYKETMATPEAADAAKLEFTPERLAIHEAVIASKLNKIRSKPELIKQFAGLLDIWAAIKGDSAEEHAEVWSFLAQRCATMSAADVIDAL